MPLILKSLSCEKMGLKSSHWSCLKACFKTTHSVLQDFWLDPLLEHSKAMNEPQKNVQMTLKGESFVNKFKVSFVCLPEDV